MKGYSPGRQGLPERIRLEKALVDTLDSHPKFSAKQKEGINSYILGSDITKIEDLNLILNIATKVAVLLEPFAKSGNRTDCRPA